MVLSMATLVESLGGYLRSPAAALAGTMRVIMISCEMKEEDNGFTIIIVKRVVPLVEVSFSTSIVREAKHREPAGIQDTPM